MGTCWSGLSTKAIGTVILPKGVEKVLNQPKIESTHNLRIHFMKLASYVSHGHVNLGEKEKGAR